MRKAIAAGLGGVAAAFVGSLCCIGPILFVTLGIGAGLAGAFEPLRPLFGAIMLAALAGGFYSVYGRRDVRSRAANGAGATCAANDPAYQPGAACPPPLRRRDVVVLWTATILALLVWTFPTWSRRLV